MKNHQQRRQRGVTLWEVGIVIGLLFILLATTGPSLNNMFSQMRWFRMEAFKANVVEAMNNYQRNNIHQFTPQSAVTLTVTADALLRYSAIGAQSGFGKDPLGRDWHYGASCSQTLAAPVSLVFCDFVGHTVSDEAPYQHTNKLEWYRANSNVIEDVIYISGRPAVSELADETIKKLSNVREALENYYKALYLATPDKGVGVNHFANQSINNASQLKFLYNGDSALRNTELDSNDDHLFTDGEITALGLSQTDLLTPYGLIKFDNGSIDVQTPDNGNLVPFTTHLWVELPGDVKIKVIASSSF